MVDPPPIPDGPLAEFRVTADEPAALGPCYFWGYHICTTGGGVTSATLYKGPSTLGRRWFDIRGTATRALSMLLPRPIYVERGIFVDVGANLDALIIFYQPLSL